MSVVHCRGGRKQTLLCRRRRACSLGTKSGVSAAIETLGQAATQVSCVWSDDGSSCPGHRPVLKNARDSNRGRLAGQAATHQSGTARVPQCLGSSRPSAGSLQSVTPQMQAPMPCRRAPQRRRRSHTGPAFQQVRRISRETTGISRRACQDCAVRAKQGHWKTKQPPGSQESQPIICLTNLCLCRSHGLHLLHSTS